MNAGCLLSFFLGVARACPQKRRPECMARVLKDTEIVTQKELLMAQVIELDVVTQLLIEKGIISREQFFDKLKGGSGT